MEEHKIEAEEKHFVALSDLSHRILLRLKKLNSLNSEKIGLMKIRWVDIEAAEETYDDSNYQLESNR